MVIARCAPSSLHEYEATLRDDPDFLAGHTDLARAYELSGRYDEAIERAQTARANLDSGDIPEFYLHAELDYLEVMRLSD